MFREETKKTASITIKTDPKTKEMLQRIANSKKWTLSQTAEEIIKKELNKREEE